MDAHLGYEKNKISDNPNYRNGHSTKTIKTNHGNQEIKVPRDRDSSFSPMLVRKRQSMVDGVENVIVSMYAKGVSNSDIEEHIRDIYDIEVSTSTISRITEGITADIIAWQNKLLDPIYLIVWMDGIVFKVRVNSRVINFSNGHQAGLCSSSNQKLGQVCGLERQKGVCGRYEGDLYCTNQGSR